MSNLKLLVKIPSRERHIQLIDVLSQYVKKSVLADTTFLLTLDFDDKDCNTQEFADKVKSVCDGRPYMSISAESNTKIEAINRDLKRLEENPVLKTSWDILLLASDDMFPMKQGYDEIIVNKMQEHFPDGDGVLWFNDGFRKDLNTLPILGKKYYDRFGYVYHPDYISVYADNEFMEVANMLGKQKYFDEVIIKHLHPANVGGGMDALYQRNEGYYKQDLETYQRRKSANFYLV